MRPLQRATTPQKEGEIVLQSLRSKWHNNDPLVRSTFPQIKESEAVRAMQAYIDDEIYGGEVFLNETYQVSMRERQPGLVHLSIKRVDRQPIFDWRDMQQIKNQLVGSECEGVQLFPAESRLVDTSNQYHLWVAKDPKFRFPFGFNGRFVTNDSLGKSVNRPLPKL